MKFKQYLLNEGRSKAINKEDAFKWANKHCKKAIAQAKKGNLIYRGVANEADTLIVNPTKGEPRRSAYVGSNYYTLLIDNLPAWKQYPKRSQSIVCTTDKSKARDYGTWGDPFIVLPKDGSKIGVCSERDIFDSFKYLFKKINAGSMRVFSDRLEAIDRALGRAGSDGSWPKMVNMFKDIDDIENVNDELGSLGMAEKFFVEKLQGNSLKKMEELMHPKKNGFQLKKIGDTIPHSREVWTDGESILMSSDAFEEMTGESGEDSVKFVDKYPIDELLIMRDDLYRAYINFNTPGYKPNDAVNVWMEYMGNDKWRYMAVNNLAPIIKAIMQGKSTIDLSIEGSGKNPYSTVDEQWKYMRRLEFKGLEDLADEETLEMDKEDWGIK